MNRTNAAFLWSGSQTRQGLHPIAYDRVTRPIPEGGLGIREIATQSKAHLSQLVWRFITEPNSYWGTILSKKYLPFCTFRNCNQTPKDSALCGGKCWLSNTIFLTICVGQLEMESILIPSRTSESLEMIQANLNPTVHLLTVLIISIACAT